MDFSSTKKPLFPVACLCAIVSMTVNADASNLIDADKYRALTADKRAFRVGDTITNPDT